MSQSPERIRVSEVLAALSYALDLTEGQQAGHALRCSALGLRLARELALPQSSWTPLHYAFLLKDAGSSASGVHWVGTEPAPAVDGGLRSARAASIARSIGLPAPTIEALASQDEVWDGSGRPAGLRGVAIPLFSRILDFVQAMDSVASVCGLDTALALALQRSGTRFDPELVRCFLKISSQGSWRDNPRDPSGQAMLGDDELRATPGTIDQICLAFAGVVDAKSPYTFRHSTSVAALSVEMAGRMGVPGEDTRVLWRAALLHDIGKLHVPNAILDKPGRLTPAEWTVIRRHPYYSEEVLSRIPGFGRIAKIAGAHHEKLDGSGYFRGLQGRGIPHLSRVLAVADIFDALTAERPYRGGIDPDAALRIIGRDVPTALDAACFDALREVLAGKAVFGDRVLPQCTRPLSCGFLSPP